MAWQATQSHLGKYLSQPEGRGSEWKALARAFTVVRNGKGRVNRLNLNDFSGLWSIGTAPSSLVAGLGVFRVEGY